MDSTIIKNNTENIPDKIWDELSSEIKQAIEISIEGSANGRVKPHEEVMAAIKSKYNIA